MSDMTKAALDVLAERRRQIEVEGWTPEHDDAHMPGELANAGAAYAQGAMASGMAQQDRRRRPWFWPWDPSWWKPRGGRADLVRAGALIVAEIERLDRRSPPPPEGELP